MTQGRPEGPADVSTSERMATVGAAKGSALKHKLLGEPPIEPGRDYVVDPREVDNLVEQWPAAPKQGAEQMIRQYGPPNEATPTMLFWYDNGPWKRTVVSRNEVVHEFPTSHTDFLTQYVDYRVPVDRFDDIAAYDGSCLADRTLGEAGARCDSEAMNILTLNLMHDIVTGAKTVDQAREAHAENAAAYTMGRSAPEAERLRLPRVDEPTADPDEAMIGEAIGRQTVRRARDVLSGEDRSPPGM